MCTSRFSRFACSVGFPRCSSFWKMSPGCGKPHILLSLTTKLKSFTVRLSRKNNVGSTSETRQKDPTRDPGEHERVRAALEQHRNSTQARKNFLLFEAAKLHLRGIVLFWSSRLLWYPQTALCNIPLRNISLHHACGHSCFFKEPFLFATCSRESAGRIPTNLKSRARRRATRRRVSKHARRTPPRRTQARRT